MEVFVVTGGSSGIGAAVARRLVARGAAVVLGSRGEEAGAAMARSLGPEAVFVPCDVTEEAQVQSLVDTAVERFGRLDGAFNNAGGVVSAGARVDGVATAAWAAELTLNLTSVFWCVRAELAAVRACGARGAIVNNASLAGAGGVPGLAPYTAAKHGVVGLTRSVALECAEEGIRVNAILTGNADTPLYRSLLGVGADAPRDSLDAPNPSARVADPDEIAAFVAWLLSSEASFVTGAALAIDGGFGAG